MRFYSTSSATAKLYRKDSVEETWNWITGMFRDAEAGTLKGKSFIASGYNLDKVDGRSRGVSVGSVYKYYSRNTGPYYLTIQKVSEYSVLQYSVELQPMHGSGMKIDKGDSGVDIMRFSIDEHPEGSMLTIDRLETGYLTIFSKILGLFNLGFNKKAAVGRLVFIIGGNQFPMGSSYSQGNLHVKRNDSLARSLI